MKMNFIKPLAIAALVGMGMFSCAGTDDARTDTGTQNTENTTTVGAETGTTGTVGAETDTQMGTETDTQMGTETDQGLGTTETERLSNEEVAYEDIFENVENTEQYDVLTLLQMDPNFSTFTELLQRSGLEASLQMAEPVTLLAPTNEAFDEMDRGQYESLTNPENTTELVQFVQQHILPSKVYQEGFNTTQVISTRGEGQIEVDTRMNGEEVYIGGAQIMVPNVEASNGVIHVMNGVITPSEVIDPAR